MRCKDKETLSYPRVLLNSKGGFTLVEIMVSFFILTVILTGLFLSLSTGELSSSISSIKLDAQERARRVMDWIIKDVRQTSFAKININGYTDSYIKFEICSDFDDTTYSSIWSDYYIEYSYNDSEKRLTRARISSAGVTEMSWDFDNIMVAPFDTSDLENNRLIVTITSQKQQVGLPTVTSTLTSEIRLRNG